MSDSTAVQRLRSLLTPGPNDWLSATPKAPLGPYGQHADPVAALENFRYDLRQMFKAMEELVGGTQEPPK